MLIHTYGNPEAPAVVLLHPMLVTGRQVAERIGLKLSGEHFVISPDQGGHGEDRQDYVSAEKEAAALHRFLTDQGIREVSLLWAASLGGDAAMALLSLGGIHYHAIHLDGIPLARVGGFNGLLAPAVMLLSRKKARKDEAAVAAEISRLYGEELGKSMTGQLAAMSLKSVRAAMKAVASGCAVPLPEDRYDRLTFEWGEKEINIRQGKPLAEQLYPRARIIVREGLEHCVYMTREPEAYVRELEEELKP